MQECDSFKASQLISSIKIRVQINHFPWKTEILIFYYVPSSMLGPLQMLSHLILTIFLQHRCFYYLSFTVEEQLPFNPCPCTSSMLLSYPEHIFILTLILKWHSVYLSVFPPGSSSRVGIVSYTPVQGLEHGKLSISVCCTVDSSSKFKP